MNTSIVDAIVEQLRGMPQHLQQQVLEFAQALSTSELRWTPGNQLLHFAGSIPADDLQLMQKAIEDDCGQVDFDER
jgi:hypothetical protein